MVTYDSLHIRKVLFWETAVIIYIYSVPPDLEEVIISSVVYCTQGIQTPV